MAKSAVQFATDRRVHISLAVAGVDRSTQFYQTVFDADPTKTRPGYARFEVAEPPLNLSIIQSSEAKGRADATSIKLKPTVPLAVALQTANATRLSIGA